MNRTLVTGASGFIGLRLVERLLARGDEVACLVRPTSQTASLERLGTRLVTGTLEDQASLTRALRDGFGGPPADRVQHLAGRIHARTPREFLEANEAGVDRICRAAATAETPPVVVVASSLAAVGPSLPGEPHDEATPCRPISNYGRSKLAGEHAARRWADRVPLSIVRPPVVFGPGDRNGLLLFKTIRRTRFHFVPQMQGLPLSLVCGDDLAEALTIVGDKGERCQPFADGNPDDPVGVYFTADPCETSYAEMGRMAAAALGCRVWVLCRRKYPVLPLALANDVYGRLTGKASLLGMDKLREASASGWVCRGEKLRSGLGWRPAKPLDDWFAQTAAWYRSEGWL